MIDTLSKAVSASLDDAEFRKVIGNQGARIVGSSPDGVCRISARRKCAPRRGDSRREYSRGLIGGHRQTVENDHSRRPSAFRQTGFDHGADNPFGSLDKNRAGVLVGGETLSAVVPGRNFSPSVMAALAWSIRPDCW